MAHIVPSVYISILYFLSGVKSWIKYLVSLKMKVTIWCSVFQTREEKTDSQFVDWCSKGTQGSASEREH